MKNRNELKQGLLAIFCLSKQLISNMLQIIYMNSLKSSFTIFAFFTVLCLGSFKIDEIKRDYSEISHLKNIYTDKYSQKFIQPFTVQIFSSQRDTNGQTLKYHIMLDEALSQVPQTDKSRLFKRFFEVIKFVFIRPEIENEVGEITSIKIHWKPCYAIYNKVFKESNTMGAKSEDVELAIRFKNLKKPFKINWGPNLPNTLTYTSEETIFLTHDYEADIIKSFFNLLSQSLLSEIAVTENYQPSMVDRPSRLTAIAKLTDQTVLENIARDDWRQYLRDAAKKRLEYLKSN